MKLTVNVFNIIYVLLAIVKSIYVRKAYTQMAMNVYTYTVNAHSKFRNTHKH